MKALRALGALLCALSIPTAVMAQTQPPPSVPTSNGSYVAVQPSALVTAPSGGGAGAGAVVAEDKGLPSASVGYPVTLAPTVTSGSAYASGNVVGGLLTVTGALRETVAGTQGRAILQGIVVNFKSSQTAPIDVVLFSANPTNSTFTDKTALAVNVADSASVIRVVPVTACTNLGTPSSCSASGLALPVWNLTDSKIYAVVVTRGTPTFTATTDLSVSLSFLQ